MKYDEPIHTYNIIVVFNIIDMVLFVLFSSFVICRWNNMSNMEEKRTIVIFIVR